MPQSPSAGWNRVLTVFRIWGRCAPGPCPAETPGVVDGPKRNKRTVILGLRFPSPCRCKTDAMCAVPRLHALQRHMPVVPPVSDGDCGPVRLEQVPRQLECDSVSSWSFPGGHPAQGRRGGRAEPSDLLVAGERWINRRRVYPGTCDHRRETSFLVCIGSVIRPGIRVKRSCRIAVFFEVVKFTFLRSVRILGHLAERRFIGAS